MRVLPLLLLVACTQKAGFGVTPDDSQPVDTGYVHDSDTDTADTDGDQDDDGFTPEEGDCDDDNVYVSPAREEDDGDGFDNDCDGRVDEAWSGVDIVYANEDGASEILTIDAIGRVTDEVSVDSSCGPVWLDHASWTDPGAGWVINSGYAAVSTVDSAGNCTDIADFSDAEVYPYGVYGIATGPDGTIYATTLDALYTVGMDGTTTAVATWSCNFDDPSAHEMAVYSLAVDPVTGTVGLFGYYGGFGTWSPTDGLQVRLTEDLEAPAVVTNSGAHRDEGGWYTPGADLNTGAYFIYGYDEASAAWAAEETWSDEDWLPFMLAIDGDTGDYYLTANAGWFYTVWRVVRGSGYAADLYTTDGTVPHRAFYGIVSDYTHGG